MNTFQEDVDLIHKVAIEDLEALQDAQFTLEAIKSADPGTYDEIIDESLRLIRKAMNISYLGALERIADQLGVAV
jgi:hypothetical protein